MNSTLSVGLDRTGCCAFTQMRFSDEIVEDDLKALLEYHEAAVKGRKYDPTISGGAPTLWCAVVLPDEEKALPMLKAYGFIPFLLGDRRNGYPEGQVQFLYKTFAKE